VQPHSRRFGPDEPVDLGDRHLTPREALDLVEQAKRKASREVDHKEIAAPAASPNVVECMTPR
jgi:hypothetical protein